MLTESRNHRTTEGQGESVQSVAIIKGRNSVKILQKMTVNNPKLDVVNVEVHTKFG